MRIRLRYDYKKTLKKLHLPVLLSAGSALLVQLQEGVAEAWYGPVAIAVLGALWDRAKPHYKD